MREIFEFTYIDAWNYLRKCTYECVKILNLHILMHEVLFFVMRAHGWMHESIKLIFSFIFCHFSIFRKKCIAAVRVHECMRETLFNRFLSLFRCLYVMTVHKWMHKTPFCHFCLIFIFEWECMCKCIRLYENACTNTWEFIFMHGWVHETIFLWMRMPVQMH